MEIQEFNLGQGHVATRLPMRAGLTVLEVQWKKKIVPFWTSVLLMGPGLIGLSGVTVMFLVELMGLCQDQECVTLRCPSLVEVAALGILMRIIIARTSPHAQVREDKYFLRNTASSYFFCKKLMGNGVTGLAGVVAQLRVVNLE